MIIKSLLKCYDTASEASENYKITKTGNDGKNLNQVGKRKVVCEAWTNFFMFIQSPSPLCDFIAVRGDD